MIAHVGFRFNALQPAKILEEKIREAGLQREFRKCSNLYRSEGRSHEKGWLSEVWGVLFFEVDSEEKLSPLVEVTNSEKDLEWTLLTVGEQVLLRPHRPLPHPLLFKERLFLQCAAEVTPDFVHPVLGQSLIHLVNSDRRGLEAQFFTQGPRWSME